MQEIKKEEYPRRRKNIVWKEVAGKGILLNVKDGAYFEVDPVGLMVWKQCDGKTLPKKIAQSTARRFGAGLQQVERDLGIFLKQLRRKGML